MKSLFFVFFICPIFTFAQFHIKGKIINLSDKKPIADASVFLNNASAGTKSSEDGNFNISNARSGNYELIVSIIGYETYRQNLVVNNDMELPIIELERKNTQLKEVRIGPDKDWDKKYSILKRELLGTSDNARLCKILNPDVLLLEYGKSKSELNGSSYDFLSIENKALGYLIKYELNKFVKKYDNGDYLYYEGSAHFENLNGKEREIKKWKKNRQEAYLGSEMHFLRSVSSNTVAENGFIVRRLIRSPNPDFGISSNSRYIETLVTTPLTLPDYFRHTTQKGQYALMFNDCLYVTYSKRKSDTPLTSIITILSNQYVYFDNNGIVLNPQSVIAEEAWSHDRMAELLPVDYEPINK